MLTFEKSTIHTGYTIRDNGALIATIHYGKYSEHFAKLFAASEELLKASEELIGFGEGLAPFKAYAKLQLAVKKVRE